MPERPIIADTGPLVAFLLKDEPRHAWTVNQFKSLPAPFFTCEAVLTEAAHLLSRARQGLRQFFQLIDSGLLTIDFQILTQIGALEKLTHKHQDLPMSLADACLVRMAEARPTARVLTFDQHFKIYRRHGRQIIATVMPRE